MAEEWMSLGTKVWDTSQGIRIQLRGLESALHPGMIDNPLISIVPLAPPPPLLQSLQSKGVPFLIIGPLKVLWQIWTLFHVLAYRTRPARWLLVQVSRRQAF
jgi:beta-1,4-mannosyltransferase